MDIFSLLPLSFEVVRLFILFIPREDSVDITGLFLMTPFDLLSRSISITGNVSPNAIEKLSPRATWVTFLPSRPLRR